MEGPLTKEQFEAIAGQLGSEAGNRLKGQFEAYQETIKTLIAGVSSKSEFEAAQKSLGETIAGIKDIVGNQGKSINDLLIKIENPNGISAGKSITQMLADDKDELREVYRSKNRSKEYVVNFDGKGWSMQPFDSLKAAGPHGTVGDIGTAGNIASVAQNFSAASLLRMATDSPIMSQYRNLPWVFDLVSLQTVGFDQRLFTWFDENVKQGSSANVLEGAAKPAVQYSFTLQSANYLKEAMLVSFTQEFDLDFGRLEDEIIQKGRTDLVNRMNTAVLGRIMTAATAYNSGAIYAPTGDKIVTPNDWDVIAAMAAQSETATFSTQANTAIVSTNKKYRMGTMRASGDGHWLDRPQVLDNINLISNPEFTTGNVIVGDLKQYNVALRGGIIVKVGYNGNDFANNMFSVVIEQFYYDYISNMRKPAIVKGPDFNTVKTAIAAP